MTPTFRTSRPVSAADPAKPHIILVGLPGAGKSTVGRAVAARLNRTFLDFDDEIMRREGQTVTEIFARSGESHFRRLERDLTAELRELGNMVLSPGGGWISNAEVVSILRPPGRLIYLRVRPETAIKRLGTKQSTRPLLMRPDPLGELQKLFAARRAAYESADYDVSTELNDLEGVIKRVTEIADAAN